jgi:hypothetical protein
LTSSATLQGDIFGGPDSTYPAKATNSLSFSITAPGVASALSPLSQNLVQNFDGDPSAAFATTTGSPSQTTVLTGADMAPYEGAGLAPISVSGLATAQVTAGGTDVEDDLQATWSGSVSVGYDYTLYARPTFGGPDGLASFETDDFGVVRQGASQLPILVSVSNMTDNDPLSDGRFDMGLFSITPLQAGGPFHLAPTQVGFVPAGGTELFSLAFDTSQVGDFTRTFELGFASPRAQAGPIYFLDLTVHGTVTAPEPSAWALLLVGFGLAGGTLRRHRPPAAA